MKYIVILTAFILTACLPRLPNVIQAPSYQTVLDTVSFGKWLIENCQLVTGNTDLRLETDGSLSADRIYFKITGLKSFVTPPHVKVNTLNTPVYVEGQNRTYSFELPYNSQSISKMWPDYAFIFITYTPKGATTSRQAYFRTRTLMDAITHLKATCHK